jgi:hypothetical protein
VRFLSPIYFAFCWGRVECEASCQQIWRISSGFLGMLREALPTDVLPPHHQVIGTSAPGFILGDIRVFLISMYQLSTAWFFFSTFQEWHFSSGEIRIRITEVVTSWMASIRAAIFVNNLSARSYKSCLYKSELWYQFLLLASLMECRGFDIAA